jgi:hypothetical protein
MTIECENGDLFHVERASSGRLLVQITPLNGKYRLPQNVYLSQSDAQEVRAWLMDLTGFRHESSQD